MKKDENRKEDATQRLDKLYEGREENVTYNEYMKQLKLTSISFGFPQEWQLTRFVRIIMQV